MPLARTVLSVIARGLNRMKDLLFVGLTVVFFGASWLYAKTFDHL